MGFVDFYDLFFYFSRMADMTDIHRSVNNESVSSFPINERIYKKFLHYNHLIPIFSSKSR